MTNAPKRLTHDPLNSASWPVPAHHFLTPADSFFTRSHAATPHIGIDGYAWNASAPHFCLTCHPDGQAANHPDSQFPIGSGPHEGLTCASCHDRSRGPDRDGENTDCIGCHLGVHSQGRMADKHAEVGGYQWLPAQPNFCLRCHPRGFAEDD